MHKGRNYRQVLPHNLTPDMIGQSAPVRLLGFFQFNYASDFVVAVSEISETLKVDLPTMSIQWRGKLIFGSFEFAWLLQQRLFDHEAGISYRVVIVDNIGGQLQAEWHWDEGDVAWTEGDGGAFYMGQFVSSAASGLFGTDIGINWFVVSYHDEPP